MDAVGFEMTSFSSVYNNDMVLEGDSEEESVRVKLLEAQEKIAEYEKTIRELNDKVVAQSALLEQLQHSTLYNNENNVNNVNNMNAKKRKQKQRDMMIEARRNFYHQNKNNADLFADILNSIPVGLPIPWQWKKHITDALYEQSLMAQ